MEKLAFYRQARADGGVRTGVDLNDTPLLHDFQKGTDDRDPTILWYVDVEFEGDALPRDAEEARQWLLRRSRSIANSLLAAADEISAGIDVGSWPVKQSMVYLPRGVLGTVGFSAIRRVDCRQIAERLRELANQWRSIIRALPPMREAA